MSKPHKNDLDDHGISPRDIIAGDSLTLVGFKGQRRRVSLAAFMDGEMPNHHIRRQMGWILPSLDGEPPNPKMVANLVRCQLNLDRKAFNIAKQKALKEERERKRAAKRADKLERRAQLQSEHPVAASFENE